MGLKQTKTLNLMNEGNFFCSIKRDEKNIFRIVCFHSRFKRCHYVSEGREKRNSGCASEFCVKSCHAKKFTFSYKKAFIVLKPYISV